MRVTIKDVAERTGYSITTVSQVLNDKDINVTKETKELIKRTAEEMNYRPNQLAVSLITRKTNVIGLIVPDIRNPFFNELIHVIEEEVKKKGYTIFLGASSGNVEDMIKYLDMFIDHQVDGCIVVHNAEPDVESIWHRKLYHYSKTLPLVIVDGTLDHPVHQVGINNKHGGYIATRHLFQLGHKRIGCLTGPRDHYTSNQRLSGYKDCLLDRGIEFDSKLVYEGDFSMDTTEKALDVFLENGATAVFALNDQMAFGLYKSIQDRGLRIPDDISIVGFDNVKNCEVVTPRLTTVNQPIAKIGKSAAKSVFDRMQDTELEVISVQLYQPNLIIRDSAKEKKEKEN